MATTRRTTITVRQAAFIGVGAMVGAGIFSLLGAAGEVAGAAVWVSFLIAGVIAAFQGYSFAKFGARYPSSGGLLEYLARGFGEGHFTGVSAWLVFASNAIVTAMVAVSFGGYAASMFAGGSPVWAKVFTVAVLLGMLALNVAGSEVVARAQTWIVRVVVLILAGFALVTMVNMDPSLLAPAGYPSFREIASSVALTFFAFLGFGVVTFTAKDLAKPQRELPRAMYLALAIAATVYVGVSLGVFGTLTVKEVIDSGGTAIAVAAEPVLGRAGFWLMAVTAVFATAGAVNSGIYPAPGLSKHLASIGQFPPLFGRTVGRRAVSVGMAIMVGITAILAVGFDLTAIASIGSAVALLVFMLVTIAHLRVRKETGARLVPLLIALATIVVSLVVFATTTLADDPASALALGVIVALSIVLDVVWKWIRGRRGDEPVVPRVAEPEAVERHEPEFAGTKPAP